MTLLVPMEKKHKLIVVTQSGEEIKLGFVSPSSDGFVLGVTKTEGIETSHLTVLGKDGVLSSHITPQDNLQKERKYFPNFNFKDLPKNLQEKLIQNAVTQVPKNKLLEDVLYITQKFNDWMDSFLSALYEKRTSRKEVIHMLNIKKFVEKAPRLVEELQQSPSSFIGTCKTKEILEDNSKIFGITNSRSLVIPIENQLYYFDFSFILNFNPVSEQQEISNPFSEIYESVGINQYLQEVEAKKILDKLLSKDPAHKSHDK